MTVRHDRKVSILDVMGPVMVGPSSSHTAGTARLGRVAREILDEDPVSVRFYLHPPLAATYRGHGSDFALVGGAIGLNVDDPRIPEAIRIAEQMGVNIEFHDEDLGEVHPNTARVEIEGKSRKAEIVGSSIGGGVIEVFNINGFQTRFKGDSPTLLLLLRMTRRELTLCEHKASKAEMVAPRFSPDSQRVYFQTDRHGKPAIYDMHVEKLVEKTETEG